MAAWVGCMILNNMTDILKMVAGGVIVAIIVAILGLSTHKVVVTNGEKKKKTGRWIIFVAWCAILGGLSWAGNGSQLYGFTLAGYGLIALVVGKVVKFFQD